MGGLVHLVRGVGGKKLSTLRWESGLRGDNFARNTFEPKSKLAKVPFFSFINSKLCI